MTCLLTDSSNSCNADENSKLPEVYFAALISHLAQFGYAIPTVFFFNGASLVISNSSFRDWTRTFASPAILLPNLLAFQSVTTLVTINGTAYKVADMANLLALANVPNLATIYQKSTSQINAQQHTPMYCVHGNSADSTPQQYAYPKGINSTSTVTKGAGDGIVNIASLRVCQQWKDQGKLVNQVAEIPNVSHEGILHTRQFYDVIDSILIA
ncbi:hypothetical protein niasHT_029025 [Heterodera trifolii]|uniref:Uncharacterized protein n=1 Tax=Heterodera trifolii TaxID=157864 RepID=A0ABD2K945_9BILA